MISTTIFAAVVMAAAFFSAENLVTVIVGALASMGISQWIKNGVGAYGPAMLLIAVAVSLVVGFVAIIISALLNGAPINWDDLPLYGTQLFALATIGYKLFLADNEA